MPDSQHYSLPLHLYLINNVGEIIVFLAWNFLPCFFIEKLQFKGAVVNLTCYSIIRESLGIKSTIQIIVFHWIVLIFRSDQIHIFLLENLFLLKSKILTNNLICLILCLPDFCLFQETKKTLFLTNYFFIFLFNTKAIFVCFWNSIKNIFFLWHNIFLSRSGSAKSSWFYEKIYIRWCGIWPREN